MIKSFVDYLSANNFYYHHSISVPSNGNHADYRAESHRRIEVLFLISGKADYCINGSVYSISPGDLIIVNAQEIHSLKIDPSAPYERIVLQFAPNLIPSINDLDLSYPFLNAHLYQHIIPKKIVAKSQIEQSLRSILPLALSDDKYKDIKIISKITDIIAEINKLVDMLITSEFALIPQPKSTNTLLQEIIKYINDNITQNLTGTQIAQDFNISASYLYRFFKWNMKLTLHKYINNQKLQFAQSLLNQGYTPQYVSNYLGYDYYATFYTQFKNRFHRSPKSYTTKTPTDNQSDTFPTENL